MQLHDEAIFGDPKDILLALSGHHHLPDLLPLAVRKLAHDQRIALVRVWLNRPTEPTDCARCKLESECSKPGHCLHLVSSFGHSLARPGDHWENLLGSFARFPIGVRKVGHIAETGEIVRVKNLSKDSQWIVRPDWAEAESVRHFMGLPLKYHDQTLGVLAIFTREPIRASCDQWLRMIADHLAAAIANAKSLEEIESLKQKLELENAYLRDEVSQVSYGELVGASPALQTVVRQIDLVAPTDASVLILGESGTGKELVAREIHQRSQRNGKPLIKVNCAAIPRELYESEFFGHTKGSFTGALRDRAGRFELANGGTLFLDEIGEIPLDLQSKLLRVLQEGELERIGEEKTRRVNVRIIAATNRDLRSESAAGRFRQDLYYRLSVFPIELPPLNERLDDIPLLAEHFLKRLARQLGRKTLRLTVGNIRQLQRYSWPGNIRELQHVLERAAILSLDGKLNFDGLSLESNTQTQTIEAAAMSADDKVLTIDDLREIEKENIRRALKQAGGKIYGNGGAAELLGTKPTTLASRIKALKLETS